ncbi:Ankyrin repeat family protein [Arabidopsis thaliana]|uniref:Ankyrin repeat family protein n=1 Tax=Arabidopsis thaliana TaxID=3702 RepID=Q56XJ1_ARATH|nr:Ankyrin repeat family protein [Arabidopsis thaliana]AEE82921.1 Ankyrin repeat family protein [Arabidopsis thaliana]BAD95381.1 putative ankyrin-repeat-containing protein [Arabidopsis thaliana]|eukprot:NP_001078371.1 Ankyrin repeat family protein [Arabidopsis thaliana]
MDPRLIVATQIGSIDELYAHIHENPYILEIIDAIPFINTPLHIASASGNLSFAMELMNLKPSFARKLNTYGLSPLHLAIEEGQTRLVLSLLKVDSDLVRLRGREGMTPFHQVVRRGETDLMTEFLLACPGCIKDANVNGETALHIAVSNDRYEELEVLLGWVQRLRQTDAESLEMQFLNKRDQDGNTALHIAAYQNRFKAVKILVKCSAVNRNIHNRTGLTALDILHNQRDHHANSNIENIIRKWGGKSGNSLPKSKKVSEILRSPISFTEHLFTQTARYRNQTSEGTRSALLVIAALIITATYQTALQPPGGVYQENAAEESKKSVAGEGYVWWFLWIAVPLYVSYLVSMSVISPDTVWYVSTNAGSVIIVVFAYMVVFFLRWKRSKKKVPGTSSELILEGLTTLDLAKGS